MPIRNSFFNFMTFSFTTLNKLLLLSFGKLHLLIILYFIFSQKHNTLYFFTIIGYKIIFKNRTISLI